MRDDQKTLLDVAETAGIIGIIFGVFRGVFVRRHGSVLDFARGVVASITAAILVGWGIADAGLSVPMNAAAIGVAAFVADDILTGLIELGKLAGADPFGFVARVWAAIRGSGRSKP